jgi:hypothetical protein
MPLLAPITIHVAIVLRRSRSDCTLIYNVRPVGFGRTDGELNATGSSISLDQNSWGIGG